MESYRRWKAQRPVTLLEKAGVKPRVILPPVFIPSGTRRRATLAAEKRNGIVALGFHRARSHDIADTPACLILTPRLLVAANNLRPRLAALLPEGADAALFLQDSGAALDLLITGSINRDEKTLAVLAAAADLARISWRADEDGKIEALIRRAPVVKSMGPLSVSLPPGAFMQPSAEGEAALCDAVMTPLRKSGVRRIADLFAGCGTFAGPMLSLGSVHAAESDDAAIAALRQAGAKARNLQVEKRNLFAKPLAGKELNGFDAVVLDPPRMGAQEQARALASSAVPLVAYVSCNPQTFARDAAILTGGGYVLDTLQIVDQFIWSSHVELAVIFRRP
jgi:23S rRNA (uracil1939-C5)-methyltransferase